NFRHCGFGCAHCSSAGEGISPRLVALKRAHFAFESWTFCALNWRMDFVIIANPTSGSQAAPAMATRVLELLQAAGHAAELRVTTARGDATRFAAEVAAQSAPVVIGCGGDGTLQEIALSLDGTNTALGILPRG